MRFSIMMAAAATIAATAVSAQGDTPQSYQLELTGGLLWQVTDTNPDIEIMKGSLMGTYYLEPVALANHPWDEAAFLEHSMAVMAGLSYTNFEISSFSASGPAIGGGFLFANKEQPIAAQIQVAFGTLDGDMGIDVDETDVSGWAGYWLQPNALVGVEVDYEKLDASGLLEIEQTHFGGFGKIVYDLEEGRAINTEARIGLTSVDVGSSSDTNFEIRVESDYYFTPRYSAGAMLDLSFGDAASDEGTTIGVRGSAWLTPKAALRAMYSRFSASDSQGSDQNEFGIFVELRF